MSHSEKMIDQKDLPPPKGMSQSLALPAMVILWLGAVFLGMSVIWEYQVTPGEVPDAPISWPIDSRMTCNHRRPTLVMFAHPRCPCTRASIGELALIMAHGPERIDARVLFFKPAHFLEGWEKTDLWETAKHIPGVSVSSDIDGSEAQLFGATTSGYVLLYDANGQLLFHGGITGSRGHSGDNAGRTAIETILIGGNTDKQTTFTFGCPLLGRNDVCQQENQ
ncbi:thioredoxin domain-containing protein [Gimesia fumaroli]|uniref:RedB protein n=1 Tax=Gimesia fumaroli TaxID=2527976 RepID=A0A518I5K7_9PLAN|nr:hypothetical protein [Gimesia fumaroli]QDV48343.1 hypothetical protein Enr17x_03540 [Gimesia fumaroli]